MNWTKLSTRSLVMTLLLAAFVIGGALVSVTGDYIQAPPGNSNVGYGCAPAPGCSTDGDDVVGGSNGNNSLNGGPGNDQILGLDGNDELIGDTGNDGLYGGPGDDSLSGGPGNDQIDGGPGLDTYATDNPGDDKFWIKPGDVPNDETEVINCGTGNDTVNFVGFGPLTADDDQTGFLVQDPITSGRYQVNPDCERVNGLTGSEGQPD